MPLSDDDARLWATLIHIGGVFFYFLPALVGFFVLKDRGAFIREQTRSALNFQLTVLLGYLIGFLTVWFLVGFLVLFAVVVLDIVFSILAAVSAGKGEPAAYPVSIRFIPA